MNRNYQLGLLCLTHLLIGADGIVDEHELKALRIIKQREGISDELFKEFQQMIPQKKERDIYQKGIDLINQCDDADKLRAFVMMYKLSEVDGRVHIKEIKLLLYSIKLVGIEFNDVVNQALKTPSLI